MPANPELLEDKARIDAHVAGLERTVCDAVRTQGAFGDGVEALLHTRNQARKHQNRISRLIAQTSGGQAEKLVEGGTERT